MQYIRCVYMFIKSKYIIEQLVASAFPFCWKCDILISMSTHQVQNIDQVHPRFGCTKLFAHVSIRISTSTIPLLKSSKQKEKKEKLSGRLLDTSIDKLERQESHLPLPFRISTYGSFSVFKVTYSLTVLESNSWPKNKKE